MDDMKVFILMKNESIFNESRFNRKYRWNLRCDKIMFFLRGFFIWKSFLGDK